MDDAVVRSVRRNGRAVGSFASSRDSDRDVIIIIVIVIIIVVSAPWDLRTTTDDGRRDAGRR